MSDLDKATRELFIRSLVDEVFMATPVIETLKRRNQVSYSGGKYIERLVDTADIDDLVQEYTANTALRDEKKETLDKPRFTWRLAQLPLRYDADEYLQNIGAGNEEQLLDLAQFLVGKGLRGTKRYLEKRVFNTGSTTPISDSSATMQSLVSALNHDTAYGTLTRTLSSATRSWWQGADPAGLNESITTSSQDTAYNLTISNIRKWTTETSVAHNMETPSDLEVFMCPALYNKLRAEMESKMVYNPAPAGNAVQKIQKMVIDNMTFTSVPYLQTTATMRTWVFILNMKWWELRVHTKRNFTTTDFKWQGENSNGYDFWLARILWSCNLICGKPNSSMFLSNVS